MSADHASSCDYILRMRVEHVEYVGRLAVAHLDAERVDKDQLIDAPPGLDRDFCGEPAANENPISVSGPCGRVSRRPR